MGVVYNVLLGIFAYFPIDFAYALLVGLPPTNNRDSAWAFVAITIGSWLALLAMAILPNIPIARRSVMSMKIYFVIATILILVIPTIRMIPIIAISSVRW
ncbi:hypothetical protein ACTWPT_58780 [Nonomuraea sp. 3N208]|uniref:hypothetical protein n=1 Tax=Nonomuraea sp. 3N208 TaxID=3457421 RepID=UPI003FD36275